MDITPPTRNWHIAASTVVLAASLLATAPRGATHRIAAQPTPQEDGPVLTITKERQDLVFDADHDGALDPGDRVGYLITYENVGSMAATNVNVVDDYDETLVLVGEISQSGIDDGTQINWAIPTLGPGEIGQLTYVVTLKTTLPAGSYRIANVASVSSDEFELVEAAISQEVTVETTPTPPPTSTVMPTVTELPTPTSAPPEVRTLTVGAELATQSPVVWWIMGVLILFLEVGGLVVVAVVGTRPELSPEQRSIVIRVGIVVTMTIGAVVIMGVFGGIERGAAAGILGTVAGYLLRGIREQP